MYPYTKERLILYGILWHLALSLCVECRMGHLDICHHHYGIKPSFSYFHLDGHEWNTDNQMAKGTNEKKERRNQREEYINPSI